MDGAAYAAFLEAHPDYRDTAALDVLRADGLLSPRRGRARISGLHRRRARGRFANHSARGVAGRQSPWQPALRQPCIRQRRRPSSSGRGGRCSSISTARAHTPRSSPRTRPRRSSSSASRTRSQPAGGICFSFDNHNSVNGIREFARAKGAAVEYVPLALPDLRLDRAPDVGAARASRARARAEPLRLPGSVEFLRGEAPAGPRGRSARRRAGTSCSTRRRSCRPIVSISRSVQPDFVCVSFYKMFGYPTGVGCLLDPQRRALATLARPWFAGGTVNFATVQGRQHILSPRRGGLRGRHAQLPEHSGGRDRPSPSANGRHRDHPDPRRAVSPAGCSSSCWRFSHSNGRHMVRIYGPATTVDARRHDHVEPVRPRRPPARLPPRRGARGRSNASR